MTPSILSAITRLISGHKRGNMHFVMPKGKQKIDRQEEDMKTLHLQQEFICGNVELFKNKNLDNAEKQIFAEVNIFSELPNDKKNTFIVNFSEAFKIPGTVTSKFSNDQLNIFMSDIRKHIIIIAHEINTIPTCLEDMTQVELKGHNEGIKFEKARNKMIQGQDVIKKK